MIASTRALVGLIDRFLDDPHRHSAALGAFLRRPHPLARLDAIRRRILSHERLLESTAPLDRLRYYELLVAERNKIAPLLGKTVRSP